MTPRTNPKRSQRYVCKTYHLKGTDYCSSHVVTNRTLTDGLLFFLEHCRENLGEAIKDLDITVKKQKLPDADNTIIDLEKRVKQVQRELELLIEQKVTETLNNLEMKDVVEKTFDGMIKNKYSEIKTLNTQISDLQNRSSHENDRKKELKTVMDILDEILESREITRKQAEILIDKIVVYEDGAVDFYLKGDMHELCTNYIQYKYARTSKLLYDFIEYCKEHQDQIFIKAAAAQMKATGMALAFQT